MRNVSKRQQPNHREDNSRRSPTGLQCSEKFPHLTRPSAGPITNIYTSSMIMNAIVNNKVYTRN